MHIEHFNAYILSLSLSLSRALQKSPFFPLCVKNRHSFLMCVTRTAFRHVWYSKGGGNAHECMRVRLQPCLFARLVAHEVSHLCPKHTHTHTHTHTRVPSWPATHAHTRRNRPTTTMAARESKLSPTNLLTNLTQPAYNYYGGGGADGESAADRYDAMLLTPLKKMLPNCVV
jgi:hypothetical protein